eukprot:CAMPEP_0172500574 /NCGR_PEP_ID=MMETSP1066-20121228/140162_1 /TAXON_ID=671091 /ORGANISM="Coscinodiscus wailesii, Strain CCMP2513" /LENGTH=370 /DNA_ID=CAMNT_0013274873 /DNA_START=114 /DNA_END=1223 /DNA_ORIENTATION=-
MTVHPTATITSMALLLLLPVTTLTKNALVTAFARTTSSRVVTAATTTTRTTMTSHRAAQLTKRFQSSTSTVLDSGVSRLSTLQTLLSRHGAPGSRFCDAPNDLVPCDDDFVADLHPHLIPLAVSESSGRYVCALKRISAEGEDDEGIMPIVESGVGCPGMNLLSLNSEHLMRRIAAEADAGGSGAEIVALYNEGIANAGAAFNSPYDIGSVDQLGYGVDKYALLRVGPFPDLYNKMSLNHLAKEDEQSSLIAAETANRKFPGFAATFLFYAKLLRRFPNREEEAKDAARTCLRLKLHTIGSEVDDLCDVAVLAGLASEGDSAEEKLVAMSQMYEKIRKHELEQEDGGAKSAKEVALDEVKAVMDRMALRG